MRLFCALFLSLSVVAAAPATHNDQLALPLANPVDPKILKEIREDIVRLKESLKANP